MEDFSMPGTTTEHATFTIERHLAASPQQVFAAWSDPAAKRRWFAEADGWQDIEHAMDFRVGGKETASGRQPDGPVFANDTVFMNIVPQRRIVFAYTMLLDGKPISVSLATVVFLPHGKGTRLSFTEQAAFFDGGDGVAMREQGWTWLLGQLAAEIGEPAKVS
jgi:uncharacterized protein YndB with AHSA1/START domain